MRNQLCNQQFQPVLLCSYLLNDGQFSLTIRSSAGSSFFIGLDYHYDKRNPWEINSAISKFTSVLLCSDLLNDGQFSLTPVLLYSDLLNDDQFSLTIWSSAGSSFFIGLDYHYDTYIAICLWTGGFVNTIVSRCRDSLEHSPLFLHSGLIPMQWGGKWNWEVVECLFVHSPPFVAQAAPRFLLCGLTPMQWNEVVVIYRYNMEIWNVRGNCLFVH